MVAGCLPHSVATTDVYSQEARRKKRAEDPWGQLYKHSYGEVNRGLVCGLVIIEVMGGLITTSPPRPLTPLHLKHVVWSTEF
ncbi:unnamed protein product [Arctogadus glacialis]